MAYDGKHRLVIEEGLSYAPVHGIVVEDRDDPECYCISVYLADYLVFDRSKRCAEAEAVLLMQQYISHWSQVGLDVIRWARDHAPSN